MSLTKIDQQQQLLQQPKEQSSSVRRSSLIVNLSTVKKRSSVTTLLTSGSSKLGEKRHFIYNLGSNSSPISQYSLESDTNPATGFNDEKQNNNINCTSNDNNNNYNNNSNSKSYKLANSVCYVASPQSAPPSLSEPSYSATTIVSSNNNNNCLDRDVNQKDNNYVEKITTTKFETDTNHKPSSFQVIEVREVIKGDQKEEKVEDKGGKKEREEEFSIKTIKTTSKSNSRQNSEEDSPEPIVEVKHTSSSADSSEPPSSDCESLSGTRVIRRRTIRRYQQRATEEKEEEEEEKEGEEEGEAEEGGGGERDDKGKEGRKIKRSTAELTISIGSGKQQQVKEKEFEQQEGGLRSHFRTRQIGAYLGAKHQQQISTSSSSSKIAKCSITTNRKSTTISESSSSLTQKASELKKATTEVKTASSSCSSKQTMNSEHIAGSNVESLYSRSSNSIRPTTFELELDKRNRLTEPVVLSENLATSSSSRSIKVKEQEESSVRHQRQSFSTRSIGDGVKAAREAALTSSSCSRASEAAALVSSSSSRLLSSNESSSGIASSTMSSSDLSSSRQYKTSASLIVSGNETIASNHSSARTFHDESEEFLATESLFSSPQVRSLAKETWRDFAELENQVLYSRIVLPNRGSSSTSTRLFGRRLLSPIGAAPQCPAISNSSSGQNLFEDSNLIDKQDLIKTTIHDPFKPLYRKKIDYNQDPRSGENERAEMTERSPNDEKIKELLNKVEIHAKTLDNKNTLEGEQNTDKIRDNKSHSYNQQQTSHNSDTNNLTAKEQLEIKNEGEKQLFKNNCKTSVSVSIGKIDQRMSDACKELNECHDTKKAIDLLKMMIQMIEKAWSVPTCGDDLGFRLCNSLREAGGLDIVLGFVQESENQGLLSQINNKSASEVEAAAVAAGATTPPNNFFHSSNKTHQLEDHKGQSEVTLPQVHSQFNAQLKNNNSSNPLRLNLSKITQSIEENQSITSANQFPPKQTISGNSTSGGAAKDSDSDILTSDLGLDSTSVESLSYVSANISAATQAASSEQQLANEATDVNRDVKKDQEPIKIDKSNKTDDELDLDNELNIDTEVDEQQQQEQKQPQKDGDDNDDEQEENLDLDQEANLRKEELLFLSARLLSQCLTSENRDYIVNNCLNPVIKLACIFTMMKSDQSQRLMSRSKIIRQSSTVVSTRTSPSAQKMAIKQPMLQQANITKEQNYDHQQDKQHQEQHEKQQQQQQSQSQQQPNKQRTFTDQSKDQINQQQEDTQQQNNRQTVDNDTHAIIGTEILQHLFKHSEDTCSKIISLGGLQAILYGCRSSNTETLRHCASALVNLALYGGSDSQQTMIEQKAHVWLFPLAFNEDDNVQYYACLAIVVLVANQEIEADVLKSSTLDLVEPFVTSHEPRKFAESTTSHIHGQSASWLSKLIPLLESKREEARNLACFHFAMEAYIKREQGQTEVFKDIGAVEPLKKVGSSPCAIASKFACQALRLIGEKEPHRLSQQVPLWTCEDVLEWVSQIGFQNFKQAFIDSRIDGDLLLQLDEDMLRVDIGISNGIIRKRFIRELNNLKKIADYSSVDKSGLCSLLLNNNNNNNYSFNNNLMTTNSSPPTSYLANNDFVQYIYSMVQLGVTRDNIHLLDCEQLLRECKVTNTIHRMKLALAIKDLQEKSAIAAASNETNSQDGADQKTLDVFISYRRSTGSQLASLLKVHLQLRGFSVFIDVERLEAGKFDNNLLDSIKTAKNFILVLTPNALDRCIGDHECKDWVHKEIVAALASKCNIIPIMDNNNFQWPDAEQLPEDMRSITYFNGVTWIHDYQDACVDKVERFIRGEIFYDGTMTGTQSNSSVTSGLQRSACLMNYSATTPSIIATPLISASTANPNFQFNSSTRTPSSSYEISSNTANDYHPLSFANHNQYLQQHPQSISHQQLRREYDRSTR